MIIDGKDRIPDRSQGPLLFSYKRQTEDQPLGVKVRWSVWVPGKGPPTCTPPDALRDPTPSAFGSLSSGFDEGRKLRDYVRPFFCNKFMDIFQRRLGCAY